MSAIRLPHSRAPKRFQLRYVLGMALFGAIIGSVTWLDQSIMGAERYASYQAIPAISDPLWLFLGYPAAWGLACWLFQLVGVVRSRLR